MALADSVPGVSGGTIAFLLGFYDTFIESLNDLMGRDNDRRKAAFLFLVKLGVGWVIGFCMSVLILSSLFEVHIYRISSLFLGLTLFAIPMVIREEKEVLKDRYGNIVFTLIGVLVVFCILRRRGDQCIGGASVTGAGGVCIFHSHDCHYGHGAAGYLRFHTSSHIRDLCAHHRCCERIPAHEYGLFPHPDGIWSGRSHRDCGNHKNHQDVPGAIPFPDHLHHHRPDDRFPLCHYHGAHHPGCAQGAHESVHLQHPVFLTGRRDTGRAGVFEGASGLICAFLNCFNNLILIY